MDAIFRVDYGGMNAGQIGAWLLIVTAAGFLARTIVRGRNILGLWGDAAIGLVGCFAMGTILRALKLDLTRLTTDWTSNWPGLAVWADILLAAFIGALLIRLALKPFTGGAKKAAAKEHH
jgi:uncharacterized membrane protein YeaQ/YmgE (transglycosylase-associated protein family)